MREIALANGKGVALVDDADYERVAALRWHLTGHGYVRAYVGMDLGRSQHVYLHRLLLVAAAGQFVDHANGDTRDNRRANLRLCTKQQNNRNRVSPRTRTGYKGVQRLRGSRHFYASIGVNRRHIYLGAFDTQEQAARAYDAAAREHFGPFARLNFPSPTEQSA